MHDVVRFDIKQKLLTNKATSGVLTASDIAYLIFIHDPSIEYLYVISEAPGEIRILTPMKNVSEFAKDQINRNKQLGLLIRYSNETLEQYKNG